MAVDTPPRTAATATDVQSNRCCNPSRTPIPWLIALVAAPLIASLAQVGAFIVSKTSMPSTWWDTPAVTAAIPTWFQLISSWMPVATATPWATTLDIAATIILPTIVPEPGTILFSTAATTSAMIRTMIWPITPQPSRR